MLKKLTTKNYKNLSIEDGLPLNNLNIFIGPNGSGKSNFISVLEFLKDSITPLEYEKGITGFDNAVLKLGGSRILNGLVDIPDRVEFEFEFDSIGDMNETPTLELELLVQKNNRKVIINKEILTSQRDVTKDKPFYFYKCHNWKSGDGIIAIYKESEKGITNLPLKNLPVDELALMAIPEMLESSEASPEKTPIYEMRRQLIDTISQWRFYSANNMNLANIRHSEPKIGPRTKYLSPSGENLPLVLHNLMNDDIDFEEQLNNAMKDIFPETRKVRPALSGRLSLTVEWYFEGMKERFYLDEMSDGTVRMLCWATVLLSPDLPSLVVIDEPEIGIHVSWMRILAEWIKDASKRTQLIISTHSPDLLDHFTEDCVENLSVFSTNGRDKNLFSVKPLSSEQVEEWLAEGWQLGDLYRVGDPSIGGWPW